MKIINIDNKRFLISETNMGLLYRPNGMSRDDSGNRWVIKLGGFTKPFVDEDPTIFGKLKALAKLYMFVLESGEEEILPDLGDKYGETGLTGMYHRGGLKPHYHVQVYGDIIKVYMDPKKTSHKEFTQASRLQNRLMKDIPIELMTSIEKLSPYL